MMFIVTLGLPHAEDQVYEIKTAADHRIVALVQSFANPKKSGFGGRWRLSSERSWHPTNTVGDAFDDTWVALGVKKRCVKCDDILSSPTLPGTREELCSRCACDPNGPQQRHPPPRKGMQRMFVALDFTRVGPDGKTYTTSDIATWICAQLVEDDPRVDAIVYDNVGDLIAEHGNT